MCAYSADATFVALWKFGQMAKGGQSDQMKSLKKSNDSLKKQLENARKEIITLATLD